MNGIAARHDGDLESPLPGLGLVSRDLDTIIADVTASVELAKELVYSSVG